MSASDRYKVKIQVRSGARHEIEPIVEEHFPDETPEAKDKINIFLCSIIFGGGFEDAYRDAANKGKKWASLQEKAALLISNEKGIESSLREAALARGIPKRKTAHWWQDQWTNALMAYLVSSRGYSKNKAAEKTSDVLTEVFAISHIGSAPSFETLRGRLKGEEQIVHLLPNSELSNILSGE